MVAVAEQAGEDQPGGETAGTVHGALVKMWDLGVRCDVVMSVVSAGRARWRIGAGAGTCLRTGTHPVPVAAPYGEHMALPRLSAYAVAGVVVAYVAAGVTLLVAAPDRGAAVYFGVFAVLALGSAAIGVLVATRRPDNVVGPLVVLVGAVAVWMVFGDTYTGVVARRPGLLPVSSLYVGLSEGAWMLLYVPAALLMLYFPDGRLPSPRWRWVAAGLLVVPVVFILLAVADPTPYQAPFQNVPHALLAPSEPYRTVLGWSRSRSCRRCSGCSSRRLPRWSCTTGGPPTGCAGRS